MFTIPQILECTGGKLISGSPRRSISGISIDSRTIKKDDLFIAIKGNSFDGHLFIEEARRRGAAAIIFSNARYKTTHANLPSVPIVKVKNTHLALAALAYSYRKRFDIPVIAVTGSNGKTTTKEMLSAILAKKFSVLSNPGTQNNHIGVPMTIFKLRKEHNIAVLEVGANHAGEIDRLSWMLQPTMGVITNIGSSHLEFFKTLKGVLEAKLELVRNLPKDGKLLVNKDDELLKKINGSRLRTYTFGFNQDSNFHGQAIEQAEDKISFIYNKKHRIVLSALGRHNVYNALASIAVASFFNVDHSQIKDALLSFQPPPMRMQIVKLKNNATVINDCYNANPTSFSSALEFLNEYPHRTRRIVICGDMLELGEASHRLHLDTGKNIAKAKIDFLITVGNLAKEIAHGANLAGMPKKAMHTCGDVKEAGSFLQEIIQSDDLILIKGSRAMQMENIIKCFTNSSIH